ncbi:MAG: peptide-methionine (S)-S-oxide reductase MsrA [Clostridia bacterium]|nr:peptide-methionine (S)-S-oxide reductase MsrA [Clostridia bacterium]
MEKIYLAGGCFWCIAKPYNEINGVTKVISGYSGGDEINPTYDDVKHQKTMHRETICIEYDEKITSLNEIIDTYFYNVDPFDDGGQFIDRGHSYTLAIYYENDAQKDLAISKMKSIEQKTGKTVCVALEKFKSFWKAEDYHQDYAIKNPEAFEKELEEKKKKNRKVEI